MCLCALLMTTMTGCKSEEAFNWSQLSAGTASASPAPTVTESSELNVGMPTASGELNPLTNPSASMQGLFKLAFEGVMRLSDRYQPENWLAESVARTEKGYTIMLRAGVLFHDGKGLTAQDVVDSFEAIRDAEASPWKSVIAPITAMTAEGERELSVETEAGYAALYALTFPVVSSQQGNTFPAGTGPYRITGYTQGETMDLFRWDSWWRTPALIPSIHVMAREDAESELATFQAGALDVCTADMLTVSSVTQRASVSKQDYLTGQAELLLPNLHGVLGDVQLRHAVAQALDKSDVITNTYQNHGVAVDVPVLPDSWLAERTESIECDVDAAREALAQLGWKDLDGDGYVERYASGQNEPQQTPQPTDEPAATDTPEPPPADDVPENTGNKLDSLLGDANQNNTSSTMNRLSLTILTNEEDSSSHKDAASRLVTQLGKAGIEATVTSVAFDKLDAAVEAGEYDLLLIGYQLPKNGDLSSLLRSDGTNNRTGYASSAMDAALDSLHTVQSAEDYYNAMQKVYDLIMQDLPVYTLCMRTRTQVVDRNVMVSAVAHQDEPYRGIETWTNIKEE